MFNSTTSNKLSFEKRVIGTSARLQREAISVVNSDYNTSSNGTLQTPHSCYSPFVSTSVRGTGSCALELLSSDPPLSQDAMATPIRSAGVANRTRSGTRGTPLKGNELLNPEESVVVELGGGQQSSPHPSACSTSLVNHSRLKYPLLSNLVERVNPSTSTTRSDYIGSPRKRRSSSRLKRRVRGGGIESMSCSSSTRANWESTSHSCYPKGVTHSRVKHSVSGKTVGTMRVSLAHRALIGKGSFGVVFQAMDRDTNRIIAVKEIPFSGEDSKGAVNAVRRELAVLKHLDHPNIVQFLGEESDNSCLRIYIEYVSGGSISNVLRTFGPIQEKQASIYTRQILSGLAYLHSKNIMHRDLKGDNLLVDPNGTLKISDFGTAKFLSEKPGQGNGASTIAGTAYFMAPEVILGQSVGLSSDVWSVGCCVIEMLTGRPPLSYLKNQNGVMMYVTECIGELFPNMIPKKHNFSSKVLAFLERCLQRDPLKRPTSQELLTDEWILSPPEEIENTDEPDLNPVLHEEDNKATPTKVFDAHELRVSLKGSPANTSRDCFSASVSKTNSDYFVDSKSTMVCEAQNERKSSEGSGETAKGFTEHPSESSLEKTEPKPAMIVNGEASRSDGELLPQEY